ncbi:hypothetical protein [Novosphingobium sp.]|uniref:hypothetical protein n=1 Tax=Novosphingobium sp. TaxID=1874826 RepID=UPI0027334C32|nr:hypothetical protein [Novosphingobium sp.]MDP3906646.1 hypothetical protein [Novosphingobium sp.]
MDDADNTGAADTSVADPGEIARARRRRQKRRKRGIEGWLRGRQAGQLLAAAMALVGASYVVANALDAWFASTRYGKVTLGMSAAQVQAALGKPQTAMGSGTWQYRNGRKSMTAGFSADGTLDRITCAEQPDSLELCPKTMGIRVGTVERELILKLGAPDRIQRAGDQRILQYSGLGLTFRFRGPEVGQIELTRSDNTIAFVRQIGWLLIP